ncbi:CHAT domain-containing protein [Sorangium sp. So ce131]|uniref:CHAT domain-containing protein n=1 Tax=Sorangium sp. So ce131 TaxID=3133282 RepID=UPI003F5DF06C
MRDPEFVVDIEPGGAARLRLSVHAPDLAPIDDEVERPLPSLLPADLDELRSGYGSERMTETVAAQVTDWLLQNDLRGHLGTALRAATQPFRIVIRSHPEVAPYLADIPFELLKFGSDPLALQPWVRAIVHMLKRRGASPWPAQRRSWPFRVLLVRTNPGDLGGMVPPVLPVRERILDIARERGLADVVEVTVLSSEAGDRRPVTYDAFRAELRDTSYSLLVYLGHGDLQDVGFEGFPPIGVLQFEVAGSSYANPIRADQIRSELQNRPIPVVVLAGCTTAASDALKQRLPQWMRGCQSVAQSLIHGASGVECAIGMRHRLETTDAERFLQAFIRSLLQQSPGDVERAVRAGREEMFAQKPYPPSWAAPVLFRAASPEPLFEFLHAAPSAFDPLDDHDEELRQKAWKALSELPASLPPEGRSFANVLLDGLESAFLKRKLQTGACLMWPERLEARPGGTVTVRVHHQASLPVSRLEGRLTFPEGISAQAARRASALKAAGMNARFGLDQPGEVQFEIVASGADRRPSREPVTLAAGPVFEVDLSLPNSTLPAVYPLRVDSLDCEPKSLLCGWTNAIVVSPP